MNSVASFSDSQRRLSCTSQINGLPTLPFSPFATETQAPFFGNMPQRPSSSELPRFIKPLPAKIGPEEIAYLEKKGALLVPNGTIRREMLRAYVEFVHPYMPLLDLHDFLAVIDCADGSKGQVSLILFQAVMFAGSAFIDMQYLHTAGYATRKEARKDFFQKTRVSICPVLINSTPCGRLVSHCVVAARMARFRWPAHDRKLSKYQLNMRTDSVRF